MKKLIVYVLVLFVLTFSLSACESQYEKDARSAAGKTWDKMTQGERKVTRDMLEWKIEESMKSGKWTSD